MTAAHGWAVVDMSGINVRTVSPSRRGALVNWLIAAHRMVLMGNVTDEQVEQLWQAKSGDAMVVEVDITVKAA